MSLCKWNPKIEKVALKEKLLKIKKANPKSLQIENGFTNSITILMFLTNVEK